MKIGNEKGWAFPTTLCLVLSDVEASLVEC